MQAKKGSKKTIETPARVLEWLPNKAPALHNALLSWVVVLEQAILANAERFSPAEWQCLWQYLRDAKLDRGIPAPGLVLAQECGNGALAHKVRDLSYAECWALLHVLARRKEKEKKGFPVWQWWTAPEVILAIVEQG